MSVLAYTLIPLAAIILGAAFAILRKPGAAFTAGVQHLAAGVVFAAAAGEILPDLKHAQSPVAVLAGGLVGVGLMLLIRRVGENYQGPVGLTVLIGVDLFIDGLVLGIGFVAALQTGLLLTIALSLEVMFIGVALALELQQRSWSRAKMLGTMAAVGLLLPIGALFGTAASALPAPMLAGLFAFGLVALLYLVTEELLVEAHEAPEGPIVTSMFFVGFLALLMLEEGLAG
ncbi:transporter [Erythrobacter sp. LQ02-29]|uniref:ZIP family metal transporter n=1 Tax=Erythrobacteraceae TaxID=335929 RepID=UPI000E5C1509|nr:MULTISPECIES: transporter [Erythrobacteraceae]MCP9223871.1 transporter [Erythrobacter sp. LQ02-29]